MVATKNIALIAALASSIFAIPVADITEKEITLLEDRDLLGGLLGDVGNVVGNLLDIVDQVLHTVNCVIDQITGLSLDDLLNQLESLVNQVTEAIQNLIGSLMANTPALGSAAAQVSNSETGLGGLVYNLLKLVATLLQKLLGGTTSQINSAVPQLRTLSDAILSVVPQLSPYLNNYNSITSGLKEAAGSLNAVTSSAN